MCETVDDLKGANGHTDAATNGANTSNGTINANAVNGCEYILGAHSLSHGDRKSGSPGLVI